MFIGFYKFQTGAKEYEEDNSEQKNKTETTAQCYMVERTELLGSVTPVLLLISSWSWGSLSCTIITISKSYNIIWWEEKYLNRSLAPSHVISIPAFKQAPKSTAAFMALASHSLNCSLIIWTCNSRNISFPRPPRYLSTLSDLSKGIASFVQCFIGDRTGLRVWRCRLYAK